jgi:hypothetical protein
MAREIRVYTQIKLAQNTRPFIASRVAEVQFGPVHPPLGENLEPNLTLG